MFVKRFYVFNNDEVEQYWAYIAYDKSKAMIDLEKWKEKIEGMRQLSKIVSFYFLTVFENQNEFQDFYLPGQTDFLFSKNFFLKRYRGGFI